MTKSFILGYALAAEGTPRLLIAFNVLRIMLDEREPNHDCGPNTYYNRMVGCVIMLLAEFSSQFPKEAAELGIFVGAKTKKRKRVKGAGR